MPYTLAAADGDRCRIALYTSGKLLVQGKGAEDFVAFVLEPLVLQHVGVGYEKVLDPRAFQPHMGVDESGKGDYFGPLVTAGAYVDGGLVDRLRELGVKDSKRFTSDTSLLKVAAELRRVLGERHYTLVTIGPAKYNQLYARIRNVNALLSWCHARVIENLLEKVPDCPRAISDQFGSKSQVERALMGRGRKIELVQQHRAESDMAVAAASILAREAFLYGLRKAGETAGVQFPKGASDATRAAAQELVRKHGPAALLANVKCHFKVTDAVLASLGLTRSVLGPEGSVVSKVVNFRRPGQGGGAKDDRAPAGA
jgi:ribonuclease HIII